jgi:hypothetical protein
MEFARDSLFCEWMYVIDLDTNKLKVFAAGAGAFDVEAAQPRLLLLSQYVWEFDIEKLPRKKEFVDQIRGPRELDDEEDNDEGKEDNEEDDVNGRQGNDEEDGTNREGGWQWLRT